jgi:23S rRNA A2030 N6-methylase RlmJ
MPIDIRTYVNNQLNSHSLSKESADCIYQEYLRLKDDYLAGKLHKSSLKALSNLRLEEEEVRIRQRDGNLPTIEDMALFTMAKSICEKANLR